MCAGVWVELSDTCVLKKSNLVEVPVQWKSKCLNYPDSVYPLLAFTVAGDAVSHASHRFCYVFFIISFRNQLWLICRIVIENRR